MTPESEWKLAWEKAIQERDAWIEHYKRAFHEGREQGCQQGLARTSNLRDAMVGAIHELKGTTAEGGDAQSILESALRASDGYGW